MATVIGSFFMGHFSSFLGVIEAGQCAPQEQRACLPTNYCLPAMARVCATTLVYRILTSNSSVSSDSSDGYML